MTTADSARNLDFVGHSPLSGRDDAFPVMVERGYAYIGHRIRRRGVDFSAGLCVHDIADLFRPVEAGHWVLPPPRAWFEPMCGRVKVVHAADGLACLTDDDSGLTILQWRGA